jgi:hypothetical protein
MSWIPDDLKHPSGGEDLDQLAHDAVKMAHRVLDRFPDLKRKHMFIAGGAAISSAIVVAAGVAVMRRIRAGAKPEDAVTQVTEEELEGLRLVKRERYRPGANGAHDELPEDAATEPTTLEPRPVTGTSPE